MNTLQKIQSELKAPKNQLNKFGGYNYRSCEDILEAVKPMLAKHEACLTITDDVVEIGDRVYVKATARFEAKDGCSAEVSSFAREPEVKKGMDESQITGAASSYARKYALNGLFLIDDTKDADATNSHGKEEKPAEKPVKYVDASELAAMSTLAKDVDADIPKLCEYFKIDNLEHAPSEMYPAIMKALMKKKGGK